MKNPEEMEETFTVLDALEVEPGEEISLCKQLSAEFRQIGRIVELEDVFA